MPSYPSAPESYPGTIYPGMVTDPVVTSPVVTVPDPVFPDAPGTGSPGQRAEWVFAVGPWNRPIEAELGRARDRKVVFRLAGNHEASCTVNGHHYEAGLIHDLVTDLHVFRRQDRTRPRQRYYRGRVGKTSDTWKRSEHTVAVPSVDYRAVLARRALLGDAKLSWAATDDMAVVAAGLLAQAQNKTGGSYGITPGVGAGGLGVAAGAREFKLGDGIVAKLQELADSVPGFDWDITPDLAPASLGMALDLWTPQRGDDRGVVVEAGGAVTEFTRTPDPSSYANAIRMTGSPPEGSQSAPAAQERVAADIASRPEGRWDKVYGEQVTTLDAIKTRADWQAGRAQEIPVGYTLTMRPGWWQGRDHVWLGDTVRFTATPSPRWPTGIDTTLRVVEIPVEISDDGAEKVQLVIGAPRPDYRARVAATEQRLTTLERR